MLHVNQLIGFGAGGSSPAVILNTGAVSGSGVDTTTVTFSAYQIGAASATRRVFICVSGDDGNNNFRYFTAVTIGGISATPLVQITHNNGGSSIAEIWTAIVPTGTTADIVTTSNGAIPRRAVWAVAVDGLVNSVVTDSATGTNTSISTTLTIDAGGFAIGCATTLSTSNNNDFTWTGLTEQVEGWYDSTADLGGAHLLSAAGEAGLSVTCSRSAGSRSAYAVLSFR